MRFSEYETLATTTSVYPEAGTSSDKAMAYAVLGLAGEAGELANKVKKILRGDPRTSDVHAALVAELGDVLWYVAAVARELHVPMAVVAQDNLAKLAARLDDGTLLGDGDGRGREGAAGKAGA